MSQIMTDIVNDYFKRFYPKPLDPHGFRHASVGMEYEDRSVSTIFPEIVCADGLSFSAQGHYGAYSYPRDDFADEYGEVEVMCAPDADELFTTYGRTPGQVGDMVIWPYVPVSLVVQIIEKHGGIALAEGK